MLINNEVIHPFPYAGITRIRSMGMISARNLKAPHSFSEDKIKMFFEKEK